MRNIQNIAITLAFNNDFTGILSSDQLIGDDSDSTCGAQPSHARSWDELDNPSVEYFNRSYDWLLLKGAKERNPAIKLDCLDKKIEGRTFIQWP